MKVCIVALFLSTIIAGVCMVMGHNDEGMGMGNNDEGMVMGNNYEGSDSMEGMNQGRYDNCELGSYKANPSDPHCFYMCMYGNSMGATMWMMHYCAPGTCYNEMLMVCGYCDDMDMMMNKLG